MKKIILFLLCLSVVSAKAQIVYKYNFRNNLHEKNGGPDLVASCGGSFINDSITDYSLYRPVYHFDNNCGFTFDDTANFLATGDYTIEMFVALDNTTAYRKMIDYKNLAADEGLYIHNNALAFYNSFSAASQDYMNGDYVFTAITRNSANQMVRMYVNGNQVGSFTDVSGDAYYDANKQIRFFQDDSITGNIDVSGGNIAYMALYDYVRDSLLVFDDYLAMGNLLVTTGLANISESSAQIWPNPATTTLQVNAADECSFAITDVTGRSLLGGTLQKGMNTLQVNVLPAGMYFLRLQGSNAGGIYKFMKK